VLEQARRVAREILEQDPELQRHAALAAVLTKQRHRLAQGARLN
jgi:ATP-dependent DNA helicase RecG